MESILINFAFCAYLVYQIFKKKEKPKTRIILLVVSFLLLTVDLLMGSDLIIFAFCAYLVYRILEKLEKPKTGIILSVLSFLLFTVDFFMGSILIIFAFCAYLVYRILKKLEKPKTGIILSVLSFLLFTVDLLFELWGIDFWLMLFMFYSYISLSVYCAFKKDKMPTTGKILSIVFFLLLTGFTLKEVYRDELFSKQDTLKILDRHNVSLNDDFEILYNNSEYAIGYSYHTFTIKISEDDKIKMLNDIISSKNFNVDTLLIQDINNHEDYNQDSKIMNYEKDDKIIRIFVQSQGDGRMASWRKIKISKKENILEFEDFDK